jgi:two-component system response regulator (stage 0 sporulation protein F)
VITSAPEKISVMVVDDQPGVRHLLREVLQEEGFEVELADCGEAALRRAREKEPSVILLDIKMPGMNGLEVLKELRKGNYHNTVVLMTAYGDSKFVNQAWELGAIHQLHKPFCIYEVKALLQQIARENIAKYPRC